MRKLLFAAILAAMSVIGLAATAFAGPPCCVQ